MIHLWTKSHKWGSRLIQFGMNQDCSHYAMEFFSHRGDDALIIESRFPYGVRVISRRKFLKDNEIVHQCEKNLDPSEERNLFFECCSALLGLEYDWPAVSYWLIARLGNIWFSLAMPKRNPFGSDVMTYCSEIVFVVDEHFDDFDLAKHELDSDMVTPHKLYELIEGDHHAV